MYIYKNYIHKIILLLLLMSMSTYAQITLPIPEVQASPVDKNLAMQKSFKSTGSGISLGNYVWYDHNQNGLQDLGELGLYGINVNLYNTSDCSGDAVATTTTSDVGYYSFDNIVLSTHKYCISVEYPAYWKATLVNVGDENLDSNLVEMSDTKGKIENISIGQTNNSLDVGLHHKDAHCQMPTLKVGMTGTYDNSKSWAKRAALNVEFENLVASGFCHEFNDHGPQTGENFSVHLEDRLGFSVDQRDKLSRIFRFMSDPEVLILIENTFDKPNRHLWFNVLSNSFVWYYSDWNSDFSKVEKYIRTSSWSEGLSVVEQDGLVNMARVVIAKIEGKNNQAQYAPMTVYYLWNEDNDKRQDIIVPETSLVPKRAECIAPVQKASVGDLVWFDADKNGKQDAGESGLAGISVELYNGNDEFLSTVKTDVNGVYGFNDLDAGEYYIAFVHKNGWSITTQNADAVSKTLNSDADVRTGKTATFVLSAGDKKIEIDAGMYLTPQPRIEITKTTNGGNVANIVEGDVITWTYLVSNKGNAVLTNLVIEDDKEGLISNCTGEGSLDQLNPTKSITCTKIGTAILGNYTNNVLVQAVADEIRVTAHARSAYVGKIAPVETGSVGDYVWLDSNHNGIQEAEELPLSGIVVKLFEKSGKELASVSTNASGKYLFNDVVAGQYYIKFTTPSGYSVSLKDKGDDEKDSDVDAHGKTATFTLALGEDKTDIDMGLYPMLVDLGNRVWYDNNQNGLQDADEKENIADVLVKLYKEGGEFVKETKTRASGLYAFKDLMAGNYYVVFDIPQSYKVSPQNAGSNESDDSDANPTTGQTEMVTLIAGINNRTLDMGLYQEAAKVGDRVWYDANKNGLQDAGENGVGDVSVELYRVGEADVVAITKTTATGIYLFDNVAPAEYYIRFTAPVAYTISEANRGDDAKDSDADTSGKTENFTLSAGTQNSSLDMGIYQNVVSLGDKVWLDSNHDGIQDVGETGVRDINVTIHSETNDFSKSVLTDENGNYLFTHLSAGEYSVEFKDIPYGHLITEKDVNNNENDLNDSDVFVNADEKLVTEGTLLMPGENDLSWDMGIYKTVCLPGKAVLGNLVWEDFNKNGVQDIGERGVAKVKAVLFNNDTDEKVAQTVTDENGLYEFAHLDPEFNYYVQFTVPVGYVVSPQDQDDEVIDSDADETGKTDVISLEADQINSTIDMGIHHEGSTIGDRVWYDEKEGISNGIQDASENGVQGIRVTLYGSNGQEIKNTQTNASGEYHFTNVMKGSYSIGFSTLPDGYVFAVQNQGADEEADSDVDVNGRTELIVINGIHNFTHIDAGIKTVRGGNAGSDVQRGVAGKGVTIDVLSNDKEGTYAFDERTVKITSTPDGAILSDDAKTLTVPHEGVWSVDPVTGTITFTPNEGFVGDPTAISYSVSDTQGNESGADVEVNYPPLAQDDHVNGEIGKQIVVYVTDNDSNTSTALDKASVRIIDPENGDEVETLHIAEEGTWSTNEDGSITFTPEETLQNNPTPIKYTVKEQSGDVSNQATVSIVYPDAVDDMLIVLVGHQGDIVVNVIENDSNNTLANSVTIGCTEAGRKTLTVKDEGVWTVSNQAGTISFSPTDGFNDEPSDVQYTVGLHSGERSNCATIDIRHELLAKDDSSMMNVGSFTLVSILANDYGSLNPESVKFILATNVTAGSRVSDDAKTLTIRGEGVWTVTHEGVVRFTPEDGFNTLPTVVGYTVENQETLLSNVAHITLTQGGDSSIVANNNVAVANGNDQPVTIDVLSDDIGDLNGSMVYLIGLDGNRSREVSVTGEGVWRINADQSVTFTPAVPFVGTPTPINYVIVTRDGRESNIATITIEGTCVCEPYEASIPVVNGISMFIIVLLTLLFAVLSFRKEEKLLL